MGLEMGVITTNDVVAIVVAFNFSGERADNIITRLINQGVYTIVVDNSDRHSNFLESITSDYYFNGGNVGIAKAQNTGIRRALTKGAKGVLIFDQDSLIPGDYVVKMLQVANSVPENIGIISPKILDLNTGQFTNPRSYRRNAKGIKINNSIENDSDYFYAAKPIASGQFIFSRVFQEVGVMEENYFIDAVDTEFNLRAILAGYESIVHGDVLLHHTIGSKRTVTIGPILLRPSNHSAFRKYFIERNNIWMYRKFKKNVQGLGLQTMLTVLSQIVYILFENDKTAKFKSSFKGIVDGILTRR